MKTKTGFLALGVFALCGALVVSCSGSSDSQDTTGTAGNSTTAGNSNTSGGNSSSGGSNANGGNTANGGADNTNGGAPDAVGGANAAPGCPEAMPTEGTACMQGDIPFQGCDYGDQNCRCRRANGGQMRTWQCDAAVGAGGAGNFGNATCPADANTGDLCTNGPGLCAGQQCFCGDNGMVTCF